MYDCNKRLVLQKIRRARAKKNVRCTITRKETERKTENQVEKDDYEISKVYISGHTYPCNPTVNIAKQTVTIIDSITYNLTVVQ